MISMQNRKVDLVGPTLSEADVLGFERQYQIKLPDDYRQFMLTYNGGFITGTQWPNSEQGIVQVTWRQSSRAKMKPDAVFAGSMPKLKGDESDFDSVSYDIAALSRIPEPGTLPKGLIPIGRDPGGLFFLLMTVGPERSSVFLWDRTYIPHIKTDDLGLIAENFADFVQALQPEPQDWDQWYATNGGMTDPRDAGANS